MSFSGLIDEKLVTSLFKQVPNIQELYLDDYLCYFNLDSFVNLTHLSINGHINWKFNLRLFKNLCSQLEDITIRLTNIDVGILLILIDGYNFPYLVDLTIELLDINRLTKEFINRLPKPRRLNINNCEIEVIESDAFSNMQQLTSLNLSYNRIEFIEKNTFSSLKNLQTLDLRDNKLTNFDPKYVGLNESAEYNITTNILSNFR